MGFSIACNHLVLEVISVEYDRPTRTVKYWASCAKCRCAYFESDLVSVATAEYIKRLQAEKKGPFPEKDSLPHLKLTIPAPKPSKDKRRD